MEQWGPLSVEVVVPVGTGLRGRRSRGTGWWGILPLSGRPYTPYYESDKYEHYDGGGVSLPFTLRVYQRHKSEGDEE